MRKPILLMAAALLGLALSPLSSAKLYKWVDENGNVTYSQQPPPKGRQGEEMELHGYRAADPDAQEKLDQLEERADTAREDREFAEADEATNQDREARIKQNCETARENMRILKSSARIQDADADGNPVYLDESAIQAKVQQTQQQIDDYCG